MNVDNNKSYLEKRTYKVEEIQKMLEISRNTAYSLIKRQQFHSIRVCGGIRISKKSFDEWLEQGGKQWQMQVSMKK